MQTQGIKGGVVAIRCVEPEIDDWLNTVPPLGTQDEDGNPTSELSTDTCIAGTYKESQAVSGLFEQIYGKTGLSVTVDEDETDSRDITVGNAKSKGYQNVEGTLELEMLNDNGRWEGASQGNWDYLGLGYYPKESNRLYDLWVLVKPDKKTLAASSAERLWKFYGVTLGRAEFETGQPNKFRVPFHARRMVPLMNWSEPSATTLRTDAAIADDTSYSLDTPIPFSNLYQTRLLFTFTGVKATGSRSLVIRGYDIHGNKVTEDVDLSANTGGFTYVTKAEFSIIDASGVTVVGDWFDTVTTMEIKDYDYGLTP